MVLGAMGALGLCLPNSYYDARVSAGEILGWVGEAEGAGLESLWVIERFLHQRPMLDAWTLLTYVASATDRMLLGTSILQLPLRNPIVYAKSVATLDHLTRGRVIAGIALGGNQAEYAGSGLPIEERVRRFNEMLRVIRQLWQQERVTFTGRFFQLKDASINPRPLQQPHPPIFFGGTAEAALRRAARQGDGWIAGGRPTLDTFRRMVEIIRAERRSRKKTGEFRLAKLLYVYFDGDRARARARLVEQLATYYGPQVTTFIDPDLACAAGPTADVIRQIDAFFDAAADLIILAPVTWDAEQLQALLRQVLPSYSHARLPETAE